MLLHDRKLGVTTAGQKGLEERRHRPQGHPVELKIARAQRRRRKKKEEKAKYLPVVIFACRRPVERKESVGCEYNRALSVLLHRGLLGIKAGKRLV